MITGSLRADLPFGGWRRRPSTRQHHLAWRSNDLLADPPQNQLSDDKRLHARLKPQRTHKWAKARNQSRFQRTEPQQAIELTCQHKSGLPAKTFMQRWTQCRPVGGSKRRTRINGARHPKSSHYLLLIKTFYSVTTKPIVEPKVLPWIESLPLYLKNTHKGTVLIEGHYRRQRCRKLHQTVSEKRAKAICRCVIRTFEYQRTRQRHLVTVKITPCLTMDTAENRKANRPCCCHYFIEIKTTHNRS